MVYYDQSGFSGFILRAAKDEDLYVRWSSVCDGTDPGFIGTMAEFLEAGYPEERVRCAEEHGSSDRHEVEKYGRFGGWDDTGLIVYHRTPPREPGEEVFFWLPREKLADYARRLRAEDYDGAKALLEKRPMDTGEIV